CLCAGIRPSRDTHFSLHDALPISHDGHRFFTNRDGSIPLRLTISLDPHFLPRLFHALQLRTGRMRTDDVSFVHRGPSRRATLPGGFELTVCVPSPQHQVSEAEIGNQLPVTYKEAKPFHIGVFSPGSDLRRVLMQCHGL